MKQLKSAERLILPADFKPDDGGVEGVRRKVLTLAENIEGTGVIIKVNSALRACGLELVRNLHDHGLAVFVDWKLIDIKNTMATDAAFLNLYRPEIVTVMCCAGVKSMAAVKALLPDTEVIGVTVPTNLSEEECRRSFGRDIAQAVSDFATMAKEAEIDGIVCSPHEIEVVRKIVGSDMTINTPGCRPRWAEVKGDDQERVMTIEEAIARGADRVVIGRPILQAKPNGEGRPQNPREAVALALQDIRLGLRMYAQACGLM